MAVNCITPPRLEVRTLGEAVLELAERLARVVLTPAQLSLLNRLDSLPRVCLVGPPGTGKTLVLVLVGLHWLSKGHNVLVLSTYIGSLAVSRVIVRQLEQTQREVPTPSAGTVRLRHFELFDGRTDVEAEIQSLAVTATGHTLHILMDEAWFGSRVVGPAQRRLVAELSECIPGLHLWAACLWHDDIPPGLQVERLTVPLRSAPVIVREIGLGVDAWSNIPSYTDSGVASPSDGPTVIRLRHEGEQHDGDYPVYCKQCGLDVGEVLKHQLHVGVTGPSSHGPTGSTRTSPPHLQYRDVLVLTRSKDFTDGKRDDKGNVVMPACGFVTGLRLADIPVAVVCKHYGAAELERGLADLATPQTDQVTLAHWTYTQGLERKVVVCLPGRVQGSDDGDYSDKQLKELDRLWAVSRCSSQLVWVHVPPTDTASHQKDDNDDGDGNDGVDADKRYGDDNDDSNNENNGDNSDSEITM